MSSFNWRVTASGELMLLESYGNCDATEEAMRWRNIKPFEPLMEEHCF